jgi:lipopolysaccharide biosynthesis regulator YciM
MNGVDKLKRKYIERLCREPAEFLKSEKQSAQYYDKMEYIVVQILSDFYDELAKTFPHENVFDVFDEIIERTYEKISKNWRALALLTFGVAARNSLFDMAVEMHEKIINDYKFPTVKKAGKIVAFPKGNKR